MLTRAAADAAAASALAEDAPWGDLTSELLVPADATAHASLTAREPGVFCGATVLEAVWAAADTSIACRMRVHDGEHFAAGAVLAEVEGPARAVLRAERVALNFVQRLSGIATLTAEYVRAVAGTHAVIADTRKTTPGLRALERHAVVCGGGRNHRWSLSDAVMAKDNHLAVLADRGIDVTEALARLHEQLGHTTHVEVEVDHPDQIEAVLAGGVDTIMLDNFTPEQLRAGVAQVAGRAIVEASGGVSLDTVAAIAAAGVDVISVGALTHAARALDLGLDMTVTGAA